MDLDAVLKTLVTVLAACPLEVTVIPSREDKNMKSLMAARFRMLHFNARCREINTLRYNCVAHPIREYGCHVSVR